MNKSIYSLTKENFEQLSIENGYKRFHGEQLFSFLYRNKATSLEECFNVKKEFLELFKDYSFKGLDVVKIQKSADKTMKFLFKLEDGNLIETVLMPQSYGLSICITSQVGCNMGCSFCASGKLKKIRDLEVSEMVLQLMEIEKYINTRISYVVVMGIGEPFDNYDNLVKFLYIINDAKGIALGARHISVSTCGIPDKIIAFSKIDLQVNLAISLHAPNDELRTKLMPINKAYNIQTLMTAIDEYLINGRRITIEYVLLKGVNDTPKQATELITLLRHRNVYINLIPYNDINLGFTKPSRDEQKAFYTILRNSGLNVTLRKEMGADIEAACGQLRGNHLT